MKFSYSKLNVFLTCPLQFKFKYIDKDRSEEITDNYSTYLGRGTHECLQHLYLNKDKNWEWLEGRWLAVSARIIDEANEKTPEIFKNPSTTNMFKNHGRKILKTFYECNQEDFKSPDHITIALEKSFQSPFKEFTLTGVIDKVEKVGSNIYIVDYKTGKALPQQSVDDNLQLSFYAIACRRAGLALGNIQFCMHYIKDNVRIFTKRNLDDIKKLYNILKDVESKIINNDFKPTPSDSNCKYCGFKDKCQAFQDKKNKKEILKDE